MNCKESKQYRLRDRKEPIYWIGGSSCAGKSTFAKLYAEKKGFSLYSCDNHFEEHLNRISASTHPAMSRMSKMTSNELFYKTKPAEQLRLYIDIFKEDFKFVVDDILTLRDKPLVVEGNQLMPSLVHDFMKLKDKAIWLAPTENQQIEIYSKRTWIHSVLKDTDNQTIAFNNWMKRDSLFANHVVKETNRLNLTSLSIDSNLDWDKYFDLIEKHLSE
ncbi:hypothetical protein IRB23M11_19220 [Alkalibacterium sp. m-11]|uniref:AAA domain-containing protein n=1 Tax=Alkalibacterium indicireducens TaxID=398758 RepID=A0ABP3K7Z1_9LACT